MLLVYAIQLASGVPSWLSWSPVELSSNVVATTGLAWALIQLKTFWRNLALRRAWLCAAGGMALLAVEGHVGELFLLETHGPEEMKLSIALWLIAAWLLFRTARRHAMLRSVETVMRIGLAFQVASQLLGWWAAEGRSPQGGTELFEYLTDTGELAAVLAYLIALLLAVFSANKSYVLPSTAIGLKGRLIHRDFSLKHAFAPVLRLDLPSAVSRTREALASMSGWPRIAEMVRRQGGPVPVLQLVGLLRWGLLRNVDAKSYYVLGLFLRSGHTDAVMTGAETRNGLTASIQNTRRSPDAASELSDRAAFARRCAAAGLPVAPILASIFRGSLRFDAPVVEFDQDLLVRDRFAGGRRRVLRFDRIEPSIYRYGDEMLNVEMLILRLAGLSRRGDLVAQARLSNHPDIASFARASLITFRVVTCLDAACAPQVTHGVMRIPVRDEPRWPAGPETRWGCAIDLRSGDFGPLVGDAAASCLTALHAHPVTGEMVAGRGCAGWPEIARIAVEAHRLFGDLVVVGWDLAWTPDGPVLLGGSDNMDFSFIQRCYGVPIGRSPLAPLLDAHLDRVVADRLPLRQAMR